MTVLESEYFPPIPVGGTPFLSPQRSCFSPLDQV